MSEIRMTVKMSALTDSVLMSLVDTKSSVLFAGPPGIGKTSRLEQFGRDNEIPVVVQQATGGDATDVAGFPMPVKDESGARLTRYTLSPLLTKIRDTGSERGVLIIDELPQADTLMQKAVTPAFYERRIGDAYLPEGWVVWATGNRIADRAGVNKMLSHLRNRLAHVEVQSDPEGWNTWAMDNGVHPMIRSFAQFRPGVVFTNEVPSGDDPYCTPRSLTLAGKYLAHQAIGMELPTDPVSKAIVQGYIGRASIELFAFLATHVFLPEPQDIVKDPLHAKVPGIDRLDAQFAAMNLAVEIATAKNFNAVATYITRLTKELQVSAFKSLIGKGRGNLLNSPVVQEWIDNNKALLSVSV